MHAFNIYSLNSNYRIIKCLLLFRNSISTTATAATFTFHMLNTAYNCNYYYYC